MIFCSKSFILAIILLDIFLKLDAMRNQTIEAKFRFITGEARGEPLVLLHGLFGALSNFVDLIEYFKKHYKVVVPMLPLFELDILHTSVGGLEKFVYRFIENRNYRNVHLLGNSLGGHIALIHVLKHPERIKSIIPDEQFRTF